MSGPDLARRAVPCDVRYDAAGRASSQRQDVPDLLLRLQMHSRKRAQNRGGCTRGTHLAYGATRRTRLGVAMARARLRGHVPICLRVPYAVCGTDMVYAAARSTESPASVLRVCDGT
eukprot:3611269-Rhodomonas_salina.1